MRSEHSLQVGKSFFIFVTTRSPRKENIIKWVGKIKNGRWVINKSDPRRASRPLSIDQIFEARDAMDLEPNSTPVFKGDSQIGFMLSQLMVLEPNNTKENQEIELGADVEPIVYKVEENEVERRKLAVS